MTTDKQLPEGPYKAYDLMTNEYLGGFAADYLAHDYYPGKAITTIYRPGRKKKVKK